MLACGKLPKDILELRPYMLTSNEGDTVDFSAEYYIWNCTLKKKYVIFKNESFLIHAEVVMNSGSAAAAANGRVYHSSPGGRVTIYIHAV